MAWWQRRLISASLTPEEEYLMNEKLQDKSGNAHFNVYGLEKSIVKEPRLYSKFMVLLYTVYHPVKSSAQPAFHHNRLPSIIIDYHGFSYG